MGGSTPQRLGQRAAGAGMRRAAAIDDQALAPDGQLERQRAGMGADIVAGRRRGADIHQDKGPPGDHPLEPAIAGALQRPSGRPRSRQDGVDLRSVAFAAAVEQREAAVPMAQQPERSRHAVDRLQQRWRRFRLAGVRRVGGAHGAADVDKLPQHLGLD